MERPNETQKLLDDLLSNRISEAEKAKIQKDIASDPSLQQEYNFQKDIVDGLQNVRKAELKARLNAVTVEPGLIGAITAASITKLGGALIVATGIGFGIYQFTQPEDVRNELNAISVSPKIEYAELPRLKPNEEPLDIQKFEIKDIQQSELFASANEEVVLESISLEEKEETPDINKPEIKLPELSGTEDIEDTPSPGLDNKEDLISSTALPKQYTEVENIKDQKYSFHYKFEGNKLFLYGDFKGIPYEILEVYGQNGRNTYLSFEEKYYNLKNPQNRITPLKEIEDKALIEEIKTLANQK